MTEPTTDDRFAQVVHKLDPGGKLRRAWKLEGGISAQVTALEIEWSNGHAEKVIVRQYGEVDIKRRPQIVADEFRLLQLLHAEGLPTPTPYLLDQSGEIFSTPYAVVAYIGGATEFAPGDTDDFILQFTAQLASIHNVDCSRLDVSFLPRQDQRFAERLRDRPASVDESLDEGHIRDVLEVAWPIPPRNPVALLHGDYWPGNLLWRDGQLVAVIDWEDAAIGDPLFDIANSRLELLWAFGSDAMLDFTKRYQQAMTSVDCTALPYWDLCAALRAVKFSTWAGDREQIIREQYRWFVAQAFADLSNRRPR